MACNSATGVIAVLAAALTFSGFNVEGSGVSPLAIVAAVVTSFVCVGVMGVTLAPALVLRGQPFKPLLPSFVPSAIQSLPFCILGFFVGTLCNSVGFPVVVLLVVPMVIAREVFASYMAVKAAHDETVQMLIRALEAKDSYTAGHAERVAMYAQYVGEQMHFMPSRMERLRFAALMHDIGKLVVPNHILNKPGKLTEAEFACIKTHERVSVQMLSNIEFLRPIAGAGHSDNTRFDPDDETHPIEPYIVMIADAYDAMTSTRAYRKALPQEVAFQELRDRSGVQFHPACVEALIAAIETRGEKHGAGYEIDAEFEDAPEVGLGSAGLGDLLPAEA
jgi:HD superfamily phosphodiesterase